MEPLKNNDYHTGLCYVEDMLKTFPIKRQLKSIK